MIKINVRKDLITISGHANYDEYGKDIVCASVSSIVYTTVNGILNIDKDSILFEDKKEMTIKILKHDKYTDTLINNMIELLSDLESQYPENLKVSKGEWKCFLLV